MKPFTFWIYSDTPHSPSFEIHPCAGEAHALAKAKAIALNDPRYLVVEVYDAERLIAVTDAKPFGGDRAQLASEARAS